MKKKGIILKSKWLLIIWFSESKKGIVIPNSYPYKEQLLNEAERKLQEEQEVIKQMKALQKAEKQMPGG